MRVYKNKLGYERTLSVLLQNRTTASHVFEVLLEDHYNGIIYHHLLLLLLPTAIYNLFPEIIYFSEGEKHRDVGSQHPLNALFSQVSHPVVVHAT